jgi:hypothetical protein
MKPDGHACAVAVPHVPSPMHVRAGVSCDPVHDAVLHGFDAGAYAHAPAPSQVPPHVPSPVHSASGSLPCAKSLQLPVAQPRHLPVHAASQHTPSATTPLRHVEASVAGCPGFFLQMPVPSHAFVPAHAPSTTPLGTGPQIPADPARLHA